MSKQIGIVIALVVLGLIGIVGYKQFNKSAAAPTQDTSNSSQTTIGSGEAMNKGSIKSLFGQGKNVSCTIDYPDSQVQDGTVYVSGSKMRGDFSMMTDGKTADSHMINDGTYIYSWSSVSAQGTKMKVETVEEASQEVNTEQKQNVDLDTEVDYKCAPWSVDNSLFVPPANVQFVDFSESMKQIQKSACDQIPDPDAKAACEKAMGGN